MATSDPGYIIGVIRAKEKSFLSADAYVRLLDAPHPADCLSALLDTPYGRWLTTVDHLNNVLPALDDHLLEELTWLMDCLDNKNIQFFMTARADAVNIASAIAQWKQGDQTYVRPSALTSLSQDALYTAVWDRPTGPALGPWQTVIDREKQAAAQTDWKYSATWQRMPAHLLNVMHTLARTPLMRASTRWQAHQIVAAAAIRHLPPVLLPDNLLQAYAIPATIQLSTPSLLQQQLLNWGYTHFTGPVVEAAANASDATAYELAWDKELVALLRTARLSVEGYDPILAYWFGKQLEVRNVRLILSAKLAGMSKTAIARLQRPFSQYTYA